MIITQSILCMVIPNSEHPDDIDYATVESGTRFPDEADENSYFLRVDYTPHRLFQYRENRWYKVEDDDAWEVGHRTTSPIYQ